MSETADAPAGTTARLEALSIWLALTLAVALAAWGSYGERVASPGGLVGAPPATARLGAPAPGFAVPMANEPGTLGLEGLQGRPVLVNFWATWCGPCRAEMQEFQRFQQEYGTRAAVIGINMQEDPAAVRAYLQEQGIFYRVGLDADGRVSSAYAVAALPTTVFVDARGVLRDRVVGALTYDGLVQRVERLP